MTLVPIFANENLPYDGLYAVRYTGERLDEFERLVENWSDTNYVLSYLMMNEEFLKDS